MVEGCDLDDLLLELVQNIPWDALAAAPASDRQWFSLSTASLPSSQVATSSLHQISNSTPLATDHDAHPPPSTAPQAPMTQERSEFDMDLSPDSEPPAQPSTEMGPSSSHEMASLAESDIAQRIPPAAEEPMDTADNVEDHPLPAPQPADLDDYSISLGGESDNVPFMFGIEFNQDQSRGGQQHKEGSTGGMQDLDGDSSVDEQEQRNSGAREMVPPVDEEEQRSSGARGTVPPAGSRPDSLRPTSTRLSDKQKERATPSIPNSAPKNSRRRPGAKGSTSASLGERTLSGLLAAGESYSKPIDVEAIDMLMRNFPIIQEHQVCFSLLFDC